MSDVVETPTEWNMKGEAVVRRGKRELVVFGGIVGETARIHLIHLGKNQSVGVFTESPAPSPHRIKPPCDRYSPCGGCPLLHLDAAGQAEAQRSLVRRDLDEAGLQDVAITARHESPDGNANFRHVVKVGFGRSDQGRPRMGAWGRRNRSIVPIPDCVVAAPILKRTMVSLAHWSQELELWPYDAETDRGVLRAAVLRASRTTGHVLVTLVVGRSAHALVDLANELGTAIPEIVGVFAHTNLKPGNAIFDPDEDGEIHVRALAGRDHIEERIGDITYRIGPGDFFQTNPSVAAVLYERVLARLDLKEGTPFVDLYCGVGGLALPAAKTTGWALGVEGVPGAVTRARDAAHRNGVTAEFVAGNMEEVLPELRRRHENLHPVIAVNPARRGLEDGVIDEILAWQPRALAYVSCSPRNLARDLARFRANGMRIGEVEVFDMFPNTAHSELLVTLTPAAQPVAARAPKRKRVR